MAKEAYVRDIVRGLVDARIVSRDQLAVAEESCRNLGGDLGHTLIRKGFLTSDLLRDFLVRRLKITVLGRDDIHVDADVVKVVPASVALKYHFMPLARQDDTITVALSDPLDIFSLEEIQLLLKCRVAPVMTDATVIDELHKLHYQRFEVGGGRAAVEVIGVDVSVSDEAADQLRKMASGVAVIAEVNRMIQQAVAEGASDIHLEPLATSVRVRTRVDGVLEERMILPKAHHLPLLSRIKILGGMDIAERRVPQDGRVHLAIAGSPLDLRVSTYPTMHGEKAVIRLFRQQGVMGLGELGFNDAEKSQFESLISRPYGILLVTGPTGSGKTTTLYAALESINSQDKNIISIEDPVENEIAGIAQAQVNVKAGMTFATALRSILRQDPDVIMIGEIRDRETADIAVRAAITGHLVFSTLHTNTAVGAMTRLTDLGVDRFLISSGVIGVIAQRLVRRICPACAEKAPADPVRCKLLGIPPGTPLTHGRGCPECRMTGFSGRIGIFEVVVMTPELCSVVAGGGTEGELTDLCRRQGTKSLRERGRERVLAGETTIEEVLRVTEG